MDDIRRHLEGLSRELDPGVTTSLSGTTITVQLPGRRFQRVNTSISTASYIFTSTVLGTIRANRYTALELAHLVFNANEHTDLVAFHIDQQGRFVGRVEQPKASLDREELRAYLLLLARECDRLEFLLTGRDEA